jgi:AmmeMemoRadiSam system protein B
MSLYVPIRKAAVAGSWYPGDARGIAAEVEEYLAAAEPVSVSGRLVALISPHAGLRYSGPVAAYGYSLLRGRKELTAVLVGPSHHYGFDGVSVVPKGAFETPLGRVEVDAELAAALMASDAGIVDDLGPHRQEHSLEMQLPFLQHLVPRLRLVPLLMGSQSRKEVDGLSRALSHVLTSHPALLVASSDLSHYHRAEVAQQLDSQVAGDVERFDPDSLMARLERSHEHACGGGPIVAVMRAARALGAVRSSVLRYADSGDVAEGDKTRVVGYLSAALLAEA